MTHLVFYVFALLVFAFIAGAILMFYLVPPRIPKSYTAAGAAASAGGGTATSAKPAAAAASAPASAKAPAPKKAEAPPKPAPKPAPVQSEPAPAPAAPLMSASSAKASDAPALSGDDLASASEADKAGTRPQGLAAPTDGKGDKLTKIKGIGPVNEKRLHGLGIFHFSQIAAWGDQEIAWVNTFLTFKGRIERENWVGQAKDFAAG